MHAQTTKHLPLSMALLAAFQREFPAAIDVTFRFLRGYDLVRDGLVFVRDAPGAYQVRTHIVTMAPMGAGSVCNCPDFEHRRQDSGWCKHLLAVWIAQTAGLTLTRWKGKDPDFDGEEEEELKEQDLPF